VSTSTRHCKPPAPCRLTVGVLGAAGAVLSLVLAGCGSQTPGASANNPDVHQVSAQAEKSLRAGGIYHAMITEEEDSGAYSYSATAEIWADLAQGAAREESAYTYTGGHVPRRTDRTATLIADGVNWVDGEPRSTNACPGIDPVTSLVLGCLAPANAKPSTTEAGNYQGKPATILVTDTSFDGEDQRTKTTRRTYLDTDSALPVGARVDGTIDDGTVAPLHRVITYRAEFLPASKLPGDFFTPGSLGWHLPDPEAELPTGVAVYWLGKDFHPGGGLPALTFSGVEKGEPDFYSAILDYAPTSDPFGPRALTIMVMTPAQFHDPRRTPTPMRCAGPSISLAGAHTAMNCSKTFSLRARVTLPDAVLEITAPGGLAPDRSTPIDSAYLGQEAITAVLRALTLHTR
jgi:hypothetical protein